VNLTLFCDPACPHRRARTENTPNLCGSYGRAELTVSDHRPVTCVVDVALMARATADNAKMDREKASYTEVRKPGP